MPPLEILFARFGLSLFLGFLIGLERERDNPDRFAGMRTFAIISLTGATLAFVSEQFAGVWLFIAGFVVVGGYSLASFVLSFPTGRTGITTEIVFVLTLLLGGLAYWDQWALASAITIAVIALLSFKPTFRELLRHVARQDIWAGLEFAIVWVVILPVLPNRTYDPFNAVNPRQVWVMVVLVAGLNLAGYVLSKVLSVQGSIRLMGVVGGLVSSTATTFGFARRSSSEEEQGRHQAFALAIAIASTGMFIRTLILIAILNYSLSLALLPPLLLGAGVLGLADLVMWRRTNDKKEKKSKNIQQGESSSPFALRPALQFGVLFAVVLFVAAAAQALLGDIGVYLSSAVGGVAGLDAIVLTVAKLSGSAISQSTAVRSVALGTASNMVFKGIVASVLGQGAVKRHILPLFIAAAVVCTAAAFLLS
ncbi:MAG: DUF4010 domain-containing protein [Chloroflexota bacterium]